MRILLVLLVLFQFALPAAAQEATGTITTENTQQLDADIAIRLREILRELGDYGDVTVIVSDGVVTFNGTATSLKAANDLDVLASRVEGVVAIKNNVAETTDVAARLNPAMERFRARIDQIIAFLPLALVAIAAFVLVVFVGFMIARARQPWERLAPNAFIAEIYRQLLRVGFVIIGIVIALDILNATALLSTILGAAGIIGLALGFAVRDTVENFIASVMLSIRQPFRPNDTVEINGDQGKVIRLTSRATILLSFDGNHIRIPNATVFKSRIINFTQNTERRFKFDLLIGRDEDIAAARELVEKTVQDLPYVLAEPAASAWIERLEDAGLRLQVTGWINQHETSTVRAQGEAIRQVKLALRVAKIEIVNATQVIMIEGGATKAPSEPVARDIVESSDIAPVSTEADAALDRIIDAERHDENAEDLLREDGLKE